MCSFKSIYFVIFILNLYETHAEISDKRLCADPQCKEPVSLAKTLLRYSSPDPRILSFAPNAEVKIYSKEAGSETTLWGATINGKRGYIPKHLVREYKVYKKPTILVDTELKQSSQVPKESDQNIDPNSVKQSYEVVDGTTIYLNPQDSVKPSTTQSPVLSTSLPAENTVIEQQAVSVDDSTEKRDPVKKSEQGSVIGNVLSSFSNFMDDESDSEEIDAEDTEDDDEDEEEDDDNAEESAEVSKNTPETVPKVDQDINSLHNLPAGINVSPYSLEVHEPLNGTIEMKVDVPQPVSVEPEPSVLPSSDEKVQDSESVAENKEVPPGGDNEKPVEDTNEKPAEGDHPAVEEMEEISLPPKDEVIENVTDSETVSETDPPEKAEKLNIETNNSAELSENIEPVTEPSVAVEDDPLPILDDVTTPSSVEQESVNIEEPIIDLPPQKTKMDENVEPSTENSETLDETTNLVPEIDPVLNSSSTDNSEEIQYPTADKTSENTVKLPPLSLFNPAQNVQEEHKESTDKDKSFDDSGNNLDVVVGEQVKDEQTQKSTPVVAPDVPEEKKEADPVVAPNLPEPEVKTEADRTENISVPETINIAPNSEETTSENKSEEETNNTNNSEEIPQEIESDSTKAPLNDDTDNFAEIRQDSTGGGIWSGLFSFFGSSSEESVPASERMPVDESTVENVWVPQQPEESVANEQYCGAAADSCNASQQEPTPTIDGILDNLTMKFSSDFFLLLITTAASVIIFLFIYMALDRHRREAPLVARINKLEKELLITLKENELLQERGSSAVQEVDTVPNEIVEELTQRLTQAQSSQQALEVKVADLEKQLEVKAALEEQIESLEKELETSTEVGMELNRIISEMLDPTNGSDRLKENMEQLQRQLLEQRDIINNINETLREKEAENRSLRNELERSKKNAQHLQSKVDELVEKILKIEKEKEKQQNSLQNEIKVYQQKYNEAASREEILNNDNQIIRLQLTEAQRQADIKTKEYQTLRDSLDTLKPLKNNSEALKALLDSTSIRAEIQQLKSENATYAVQLQQEQAVKVGYEKKYQAAVEEMSSLREKYELADKEKLEVNSKLEVLNNYFKKRESELQEEIIRYKAIWDTKEGEATSTTERIKYLQEEIENYKAQNETLKQEIISQEIDLKSQISVLEKKVHENWVTARQTERKLEDARQEAAQLRNRLTLRERAINDERLQNRLQSPVEQNGDLTLSPHPLDSPASPPLLYGARDHITKSPPLPGLPPFLPPPPGAPFMPPPLHGMPHFMPPPPSMFPGDHRPPPLGRMSSPPLNSRYSPDTSAFSPYDRNSPSPPYDSEYGTSPPPIRGYSPYNSRDDRRDYKRPPHARTNGRNAKGSVMSSGSDHSNDSLDKINRKQSKMV